MTLSCGQAAGMTHSPWALTSEAVALQLGTDVVAGLSSSQAAQRYKECGPNELAPGATVAQWRKFVGQLQDPLIYLLLAASAISLVAWLVDGRQGAPFEVIVILSIVAMNALLGYVQEARAETAVAALQRMAAPSATVVRDGQELRVPSAGVVPGDVVVLAEGDAVAADARIIESSSLSISEASLTGESEPVVKSSDALDPACELANRVNMVFNGTAVVRGRGRAIVTATGMTTELGTIARLLGSVQEQRTPLQREIDRVGRSLGRAVIVITAVVIATTLLNTDVSSMSEFIEVFVIGISLAVAAVPEGLPAILSVVLAAASSTWHAVRQS